MKWVVRKSRYPSDPARPWYAATTIDAAMGLGHPFPTWAEACQYASIRLGAKR